MFVITLHACDAGTLPKPNSPLKQHGGPFALLSGLRRGSAKLPSTEEASKDDLPRPSTSTATPNAALLSHTIPVTNTTQVPSGDIDASNQHATATAPANEADCLCSGSPVEGAGGVGVDGAVPGEAHEGADGPELEVTDTLNKSISVGEAAVQLHSAPSGAPLSLQGMIHPQSGASHTQIAGTRNVVPVGRT